MGGKALYVYINKSPSTVKLLYRLRLLAS
jgi:hypothetical protein